MNLKFIITGVGIAIAVGITAFVLFAHETNSNVNNRNLTSIIPGTTNTEENKSTITQGKHLQISISESVGIKSKWWDELIFTSNHSGNASWLHIPTWYSSRWIISTNFITIVMIIGLMTTKYAALIVGLVAIASIGGTYALSQTSSSPLHGMKTDGMKTLGHIQLVLYGADGAVKAYRQSDNLVVTNGDNVTANRIFGTTLTTSHAFSGAFNYIGVGTSSTAAANTQTDLVAVASAHRLATISNGAIHGTAQAQVTFPANRLTNSSTVTITESGLFDAQGNGTGTTNMFARQTFTGIGVNPADTLQVTWTVTIT